MVTRNLRKRLDKKLSTILVPLDHLDPNYKLLLVKIHSAAGLEKKDIFGLSDPYVKVRLMCQNQHTLMALSPKTTRTVKRALSPIWNERLCFLIAENQFSMFLDVYDENAITKDTHLGRASLHFDLKDKFTGDFVIHPTVHCKDGWQETDVNKLCLPLAEKYDSIFQRELSVVTNDDLFYTKNILAEFQDKCQVSQQRSAQGVINISYAMLDPRLPEAVVIMKSECKAKVIGEPVRRPRSCYQPQISDSSLCTKQLQETYQRSDSLTDLHSRQPSSRLKHNMSLPTFNESIQTFDEPFCISHQLALEELEDEDEPEVNLPEGWESRTDSNGRVVFVDHMTRSTSLRRPNLKSTKKNFLPRQKSIQTDTNDMIPESDESVSFEATISSKFMKQLKLGLHPHWVVQVDEKGVPVYYNSVTKEFSYSRPKYRKQRKSLHTKPEAYDIDSDGSYIPVQQNYDFPPGWETRKTCEGSVYYVNHSSKTTSMITPIQDNNMSSVNQTNPLPTLSPAYTRDYHQKCDNLYMTIHSTELPASTCLEFSVREDHILEDSFKCVMGIKNKDQFKLPLKVKLLNNRDNNTADDCNNSMTNKWFELISSELFNTYYGLFEHSASDDYTLQVNPNSSKHMKDHLEYFKFIGRILGMAIHHKVIIDGFFVCPFYKMLLEQSVSAKDMESVDVELHNTLEYIMDNDPQPLELKFALNKTVFGEVIEEELKPGGKEILVTEDNKQEYINLLIKWRFTQRVNKQMNALRNGVADVIPLVLLQMFDARELEYLIGGLARVDIADWKKHIELKGYLPNDEVIVWLWEIIENYDDEMRARLLQFVTGTSKVPMNGFSELQGSNGLIRFCIRQKGSPSDIPTSHTCFNRIDLPPYTTYNQLEEKLSLVLEEC